MNKKSISGRLLLLINESGKTYQVLADGIGVSRSALTTWVSGSHFPDGESMLMLGRYFDVSLDWLVGLSDQRKRV